MMADVGSLKDWEIRDGHRSGKKPRVFRQREFENIMVSAVGEGRQFYEYGIIRFPVK